MAEKKFTVYATRTVDMVATVYAESLEQAKEIASEGEEHLEYEYCDTSDEVVEVVEFFEAK